MKSKILIVVVLVIISFLFVGEGVYAQCPMCKASAESSLKGGSNAAKGLNTGILYMLAAPYLLVGFIGYAWYKNHKKNETVE